MLVGSGHTRESSQPGWGERGRRLPCKANFQGLGTKLKREQLFGNALPAPQCRLYGTGEKGSAVAKGSKVLGATEIAPLRRSRGSPCRAGFLWESGAAVGR